jgi:small subunit ribosomal protein S9
MKTSIAAKYFEAVGRRKTSVARVRFTPGPKRIFSINGQSLNDYFKTEELRRLASEAALLGSTGSFSIIVRGGGISSQAQAVRHGIARALVLSDKSLRSPLKKAGFLKRDPRVKERRKFGLKKARKAPQWSKR